MRVARYRGEKNLAELVGRLYRRTDAGKPPDEAAPALAAANQHLPLGERGLAKKLQAGTLLGVPELGDSFDGRSSMLRSTLAAQVLVGRAMQVLEAAAADGAIRDDREAADIDALEKTIGSNEFAELIKSNEELGKNAESIRRSIDERRSRLATVKERRTLLLEDAKGKIGQLAGGLGGGAAAQPQPEANVAAEKA